MKAIEEYVAVARPRRLSRRRRGARRAARPRRRRTRTSSSRASTSRACAARSPRTAGSRISSSRAARSGCGCSRGIARLRALAPAGIEFAPPRRERSTGPGPARLRDRGRRRRAGRGRPRAARLHVNAMARRLADGDARRPVRRPRRPRADGVLRTVSPRSFAEDPLRLVRGLRFVSQLGFDPDERDARADARTRRRRSSSSRRSGSAAAWRPTAWGSCRGCCSAASRARRCGSPATPACSWRSCRSSSPRSGYDQRSRAPRPDRRRAHLRRRPGCTADDGMPLRVRLATLFHDLGQAADGLARRRRLPALLREPARPTATTPRSARSSRTRRCGGCATRTSCGAGGADRPLPHVRPRRGPTRCEARAPARALRRRRSRSTCSTTRRPTCAARAATSRTTSREARAAAAVPGGRRARARRARTGSPISPSTAPT